SINFHIKQNPFKNIHAHGLTNSHFTCSIHQIFSQECPFVGTKTVYENLISSLCMKLDLFYFPFILSCKNGVNNQK
ncbi:hypothetical protein ACQP3J_32920, partial [Escherichia coli]